MPSREIGSVVIDTSVLLGPNRRIVTALVASGHLKGYWGHWITMELGRIRAEWIGLDAVRKEWDVARIRHEQDISSKARIAGFPLGRRGLESSSSTPKGFSMPCIASIRRPEPTWWLSCWRGRCWINRASRAIG